MRAVSLAEKLSKIEEMCKEQNSLFQRGDDTYKDQKPKTVLGSSIGEDVGFIDNNKIIFFIYDNH